MLAPPPRPAGDHTAFRVRQLCLLCSKSDIFRFIPLPADARFVADVSSRSIPTRASRNVPSGEPDRSLIEKEIRVLDPNPPSSLRTNLLRDPSLGAAGRQLSGLPYEVEYYNGAGSLLIPRSPQQNIMLNG